MKNIWFFGDSFTRGDGCIPDNESSYYDDYPDKRGKLWTTIVSERMSMVENNLGESGASSDWILNTIIDNLHKIKKGDWVIMSDTRPARFLIPRIQDKEIHCFSPGQESVWDWHIKNRDDAEKPKNWEDMKRTLIDFTLYFQEDYVEMWEEYYLERYKNLRKYFTENGINSFFWSYRVWYMGLGKIPLERIIEDNPNCHNHHFSWNGHQSFANHITKNIKLL